MTQSSTDFYPMLLPFVLWQVTSISSVGRETCDPSAENMLLLFPKGSQLWPWCCFRVHEMLQAFDPKSAQIIELRYWKGMKTPNYANPLHWVIHNSCSCSPIGICSFPVCRGGGMDLIRGGFCSKSIFVVEGRQCAQRIAGGPQRSYGPQFRICEIRIIFTKEVNIDLIYLPIKELNNK